MRVAQHIFYAVATLAGVAIIALNGPSHGLTMGAGGSAACRSDHLERACDPGRGRGEILQGGQVVPR
ncbi:hypothetical protein [Phenylobacterium sp.]|uniref:hypothetical protein n=1 Tax=Phenylobacterium sp. TaxID=1871053 RepID=UPI0025F273EA|nr:hypothetical protein [Phenylobacterium sp.]